MHLKPDAAEKGTSRVRFRHPLAVDECGDVVSHAVNLNHGPTVRIDKFRIGACNIVDCTVGVDVGFPLLQLNFEPVEGRARYQRMTGVADEYPAIESVCP